MVLDVIDSGSSAAGPPEEFNRIFYVSGMADGSRLLYPNRPNCR
jgi:hypothetical protein